MSPAGFEHTLPASGRPQTHALDVAATRSAQTLLVYQSKMIMPSGPVAWRDDMMHVFMMFLRKFKVKELLFRRRRRG